MPNEPKDGNSILPIGLLEDDLWRSELLEF